MVKSPCTIALLLVALSSAAPNDAFGRQQDSRSHLEDFAAARPLLRVALCVLLVQENDNMRAALAVFAARFRAYKRASGHSLSLVLLHSTDDFDPVLLKQRPRTTAERAAFAARDQPWLEAAGYEVRHVVPPVTEAELVGTALHTELTAKGATGFGCCGLVELCKLEPLRYGKQFDFVAVLDPDVLLRGFGSSGEGADGAAAAAAAQLDALFRADAPAAQFWADCAFASYGPTVNGGFLIFRPDEADYEALVATVLRGDYSLEGWDHSRPLLRETAAARPGSAAAPTDGPVQALLGRTGRRPNAAARTDGLALLGLVTVQAVGWGGSGIGAGYGGTTVQGLVPYYYVAVRGAREALEAHSSGSGSGGGSSSFGFIDPCVFFMGGGMRGFGKCVPDAQSCDKQAGWDAAHPAAVHFTGWHVRPSGPFHMFNSTCHAPWRCRFVDRVNTPGASWDDRACDRFVLEWRAECAKAPDCRRAMLPGQEELCSYDVTMTNEILMQLMAGAL